MADTPPTIIRNAHPADIDALLRIEAACFETDRISRRSFRRFFSSPTARLIVAETRTGELVGYALVLLRTNSATARIYSLAVLDTAKGSGVGSQLLAGAEALARELRCRRLVLEVRDTNARARSLYERHGFHADRALHGYYQDGADGQRYVRTLGDLSQTAVPAMRSRLPIIVVDTEKDIDPAPANTRVMTVRDYLAMEHAVRGRRVINLARSYEPLSLGYYCSLLAAARGERCLPEADALLEINWKRIHSQALDTLTPLAIAAAGPTALPASVDIFFGRTNNRALKTLARQAFDLFRCPALRIHFDPDPREPIREIEAVGIHRLEGPARTAFHTALKAFVDGTVPRPTARGQTVAALAILVDPAEDSPPSDEGALAAFSAAAEACNARAEFITRKDYGRLLEFDALLIRATTALNHYTYRFAKRAEREGIPVIDDTASMLRCTNKIFLSELLRVHKVPTPASMVFDRKSIRDAASQMTFPAVLKVPDGCFSKGVHQVTDAAHLDKLSRELFPKSDLLILQEFLPTSFDWRIGILDGEPLFACRYFMAAGDWKILAYDGSGEVTSGDADTVPLDQVPPAILETAVNAAALIGDGLYGVDMKETERGPVVIEVNDNPNIDAGIEDQVAGAALYRKIVSVLLGRIGRNRP